MINYSIIIPHKNLYVLLKKCLDSIPVRNDLQIIVIDDNSDDVNRVKTIVHSHPNAEILINNKGKGAGAARNCGLDIAKGKWLLFADSDDYYEKEALSTLFNKYINDDINDAVFLRARIVDENGVYSEFRLDKYIQKYYKKHYYSERILRYEFWAPWIKMIKRKIILSNSIKFDEVMVANDIMFGLKCSKFMSSFEINKSIIYNYYKPSSGSITHRNAKRPEVFLQVLEVLLRVNELYNSVNYAFRRPIWTFLNKYEYNETIKNQRNILLKEYHYSVFKDFMFTCKSIIFKLLEIK